MGDHLQRIVPHQLDRTLAFCESIVKSDFILQRPAESGLVFKRKDGSPLRNSDLGHMHASVRTLLKLPADCVLHSLRHTFGTRLGEAGADAFTIMRLMGHSTVIVSQRYVHPSPEAVELAFERMTTLNLQRVPTNPPTIGIGNTPVV